MKTFNSNTAILQLNRIKELSRLLVKGDSDIVERIEMQEEWDDLTSPSNMNVLINHFEHRVESAKSNLPESIRLIDTVELRLDGIGINEVIKVGELELSDNETILSKMKNQMLHVFSPDGSLHYGIIKITELSCIRVPAPVTHDLLSNNVEITPFKMTEPLPDYKFEVFRSTSELDKVVKVINSNENSSVCNSLRNLLVLLRVSMEDNHYQRMNKMINNRGGIN